MRPGMVGARFRRARFTEIYSLIPWNRSHWKCDPTCLVSGYPPFSGSASLESDSSSASRVFHPFSSMA